MPKETNEYSTTFRYARRIGQTVYIIAANRQNRCPQCGISSGWKYYVKKTQITAISFHLGTNGKQEVYYFYRDGRENMSYRNDEIIYLTKQDAQEACDIENQIK